MSSLSAIPRARRGSAYLLVLGASLLLVTAGTGAIYASGVRRAAGELQIDAWKARLAAEAGIECALDIMNTDATWRSTKTSGNWYTNRTTGDGLFTLDVIDPVDGNFANNPSDPVTITATGNSGRGRSKLSVSVNSVPTPYSALGVVACSGGAQVHNGTITSDQTIHSNASVTAVTASISGAVSAVTTILGVVFTGSLQPLAPARTLPAFAEMSYYAGLATPIAKGDLRRNGRRYFLENCVLSPASNPFGAANPLGIYIIDGGGDDIILADCRIVGTVLIRNAGNGSEVRTAVNIAPAVANYPVLIVDGDFSLAFNQTSTLDESNPHGNFNPVGTPYAGITDADKTDSYPCEIRGLIYVRGNFSTSGNPKVIGNILCRGTFTSSGSLTLSYSPTCFTAPPPGFALSPIPMKIQPGTWQQLTN